MRNAVADYAAEIESHLLALLGKQGAIQVSSLPLRDKYDAARAGGPPLILVFTQERLHLLANVVGDAIAIDLLIVDEAHKIGDNQRGVILQDAIERISRTNPALKLVFISPATQNPEELLADAPDVNQAAAINSDVPVVLQNLVLAEQFRAEPSCGISQSASTMRPCRSACSNLPAPRPAPGSGWPSLPPQRANGEEHSSTPIAPPTQKRSLT
jgi:hypothetical protein